MLRRPWSKQAKFTRVNERIYYADVRIIDNSLGAYRLICVYFPDSKYTDKHVEEVYMTTEAISEEARGRKMHIVI